MPDRLSGSVVSGPLFGNTGESPYIICTVTTHDLIVRGLLPMGLKFKSFKVWTLVECLDSLLFHIMTTVSTNGVHTASELGSDL